ncbi:MAG: hypothetical protein ABF382_03040, partial [Akkermansiaceae bacterium]
MPNVSANGTGEDTLLADLEKIRDKIRFRHGRAYERFRKDHDGIVEDFLKDTIDAINSFPFLGETIKDTLLEEYEGYLERKELPDSIPEASPGRLKRKLKEAKEETKILKEEYEDEFKEAKRDYLDLLTKTANSVLRKGEANKGRIFILENKVTTDDDDRFEKIMESEKVPLPVEPTKEDNE